ncbi:DUF424 domain-containing protein [Methanothrix harundinacea]|uniref:DUF424 domain-containing protein n=1 Tax=Methanothrix harundinacea (strain 6Ac) TaxID=1110509 RepID=G7WQ86_METH6|nr:DUF424 family protein [Methanothrix harundinacea]AET65278.1 hypothetical protein Mhar_1922 [Methanothrix harundinacea 6Ac]
MEEMRDTMYLKVHRIRGEVMVAVCDSELLGKTFDEGALSLTVEEAFFGEEVATVREVAEALAGASIANMVGEKAVACGIETKCIDGRNILKIDGVPTAQMVRM